MSTPIPPEGLAAGAAGMRGWRRTFWVVCAANLVSGAGLMSFLPFFPTVLEGLGMANEHERALWSGLLFGAAPLAAGFSGPLWGSVGDRFGRKLMVVRSLLGLALFVGAMAYARSAWMLLFLRIGQGAFSGYMAPSLTLVSVAAPHDRQGRVTSWIQTASTVGTIAGPLLGVLLLRHGGIGGIFAFTAVASAFSAALVWFLAVEEPLERGLTEPSTIGAVVRSSFADLRALLGGAPMREALLLYAAVHFALGATHPLMEFFVEAVWDGAHARVEPLTGTLFSVLAIAAIVATPMWGRFGDRYGHALALRTSSALSALTLLLHALVPSYAWLFAARAAFGLVAPGASASAFGLAATGTERERRGAAMGAVFSARCFAVSGGAFAGGALMAGLGIRGLFAAAGAAVGLALVAGRRRRFSG
jgi:DHA1 family multidrug resistance protein-like MFS transporter